MQRKFRLVVVPVVLTLRALMIGPASAHRIPVKEAKPVDERGLYLHPVELGQPAEPGLDYQRVAGAVRRLTSHNLQQE